MNERTEVAAAHAVVVDTGGIPYLKPAALAGLRVVNPPTLVSDPSGPVTIAQAGIAERPRSPRRFRVDPDAALHEVAAQCGGIR